MKPGERGSALIETILVGLLFMVPLIWLVGVLADVHRGALASTAAAREAGMEAARATSTADAERAIDIAVAEAFRDHGLDPADARVTWSLAPDQQRGGAVVVDVGYAVTVLQAPFLGRVGGPSLDVNARHVARIDQFRSRP